MRDLEAVWIGDGPEHDRRAVEELGVKVTGWLNRDEATAELRAADLYLHTAAWEGFPLSVIEAVRAGVPVFVRPIPAFAQVPAELQFGDALDRFVRSEAEERASLAASNIALWGRLLEDNMPEAQRAALVEVFAW